MTGGAEGAEGAGSGDAALEKEGADLASEDAVIEKEREEIDETFVRYLAIFGTSESWSTDPITLDKVHVIDHGVVPGLTRVELPGGGADGRGGGEDLRWSQPVFFDDDDNVPGVAQGEWGDTQSNKHPSPRDHRKSSIFASASNFASRLSGRFIEPSSQTTKKGARDSTRDPRGGGAIGLRPSDASAGGGPGPDSTKDEHLLPTGARAINFARDRSLSIFGTVLKRSSKKQNPNLQSTKFTHDELRIRDLLKQEQLLRYRLRQETLLLKESLLLMVSVML